MKLFFQFLRCLNFYCKSLFWTVILLQSATVVVWAITLNGVYFGTCQREVGLILNVDDNKIQLLNQEGVIQEISRFDIVYLADYPVGNMPIPRISNVEKKEIIVIDTLIDYEPKELVQGWPLDFSEKSILFLTTDGDEIVISRDNIYSVSKLESAKAIDLKNTTKSKFYYHYPALFSHCETDLNKRSNDATNYVYPQQLIGNALLIKSNLDHLMKGHKLINSYVRDQQFYALPGLYDNTTKIGLWYNYNSRHGASSGRNNNIIPYIISDYSDGPFGFQRRITTGVYTMSYSVHEEPQTLFSYELKADYFHFSAMFDPSMIMTGPNYQWKEKDLGVHDDRIFELLHLNAGADWGSYAIEVGIPVFYIGIRNGDYFANQVISMYRYRLLFQNQYLKTDLYYGSGTSNQDENKEVDDEDYEEGLGANINLNLLFIRYNIALKYIKAFEPRYSLIYRKVEYERNEDIRDVGQFEHASESITNYFALDYFLENDITITGYASIESNQIKYDSLKNGPGSETNTFIKAGTSIMLEF